MNNSFQNPQPDRSPHNTLGTVKHVLSNFAFSILSRIKVPTTADRQALYLESDGFQYPQPDRSPHNYERNLPRLNAFLFQYPQPDRSPHNSRLYAMKRECTCAFSIL